MKILFSVKQLFLILIFSAGLIKQPCVAQEMGSCAEKLKTAQTLFERGQVEQVPQLLNDCLRSGFSREEELIAYKLIVQSYLFVEDQVKSDSAMLEFLRKNPEYQLSPTDHSNFVYLYKTFRVKPVVKVGIHLGTNIPFLSVIEEIPVEGDIAGSNNRSELLNLFLSLETKYELTEKLEINIEPGYSVLSFTNKNKYLGTTTYTEKQSRIEVPLSITYTLKKFNNLSIYGRLGFGPSFLSRATATPDYKPNDINGTPHSGSDLERNTSRISMDLFGQLGAGVRYKRRNGYFFGEVRSNWGFFNQVIEADSREETELEWHYYYADDKFRMNAVNISFGYTMIFYKPSKIR